MTYLIRPLIIFCSLSLLCSSSVQAQNPYRNSLTPTLEQPPHADPRFGLVQTYDDFEAATDAGAGYTRIKLYWDIIQPNGPDEWRPSNVPDPLVEADISAGRQVVGLIVRTPAWARDLNHPRNDPRNPQAKDVPDREAWGQFVYRLTEQYRHWIDHWIIWNEPDVWDANHPGSTWNGSAADYIELLKAAYRNIKAFDPDKRVYIAGLTYWWDKEYDREQYLARLLKLLQEDPEAAAHDYYFDGVIYHLYYKPEQIYGILRDIRTLLDRNGFVDKAIWLNETNAPPSHDPAEPPHREPRFKATLTEQSAFMIQVHALSFAAGVERIQVYKLFNSTEHPEDVQPFGLLRGDKSRRPAFAAYQTVTTYLSDFKKVRAFYQGEVHLVIFERPTGTTSVIWNVAQQPRHITLDALADQALLVDEIGQTQIIAPQNRLYQLTLPPAECSSGDCFIGGPPRLLVEPLLSVQRASLIVAPTPTPIPPPEPTFFQIAVASPRRRLALALFSSFWGVVLTLTWLWLRKRNIRGE